MENIKLSSMGRVPRAGESCGPVEVKEGPALVYDFAKAPGGILNEDLAAACRALMDIASFAAYDRTEDFRCRVYSIAMRALLECQTLVGIPPTEQWFDAYRGLLPTPSLIMKAAE